MSCDDARRSVSATLHEIVEGERILREAGADVRDPGDWMMLRDIVARIERRLALQIEAKEPAE